MGMSLGAILEVLTLLALANGAPVIATRVLGERWAWPLDAGFEAPDGRRLLGPRKTVRGLVVAMAATAVGAAAFGDAWWIGALFGAAAMAGDALSSFVKRRLAIEPSGQAAGLDQIPEALLPLLACYVPLGLTPWGVAILVALFSLGQAVVSPLMYRLGVRRRPY